MPTWLNLTRVSTKRTEPFNLDQACNIRPITRVDPTKGVSELVVVGAILDFPRHAVEVMETPEDIQNLINKAYQRTPEVAAVMELRKVNDGTKAIALMIATYLDEQRAKRSLLGPNGVPL